MKHFFLAAILVTFSSLHLDAATRTVTNTNDEGPGSLRQSIADAMPGDTINFSVTGTITLTSGQLVIDKNLTIQGPGARLLSISGDHSVGVLFNDQGATTTVDAITIKDGPGGIANGGTLTVSNSIISGNGSEGYGNYTDGGGIYNASSGIFNLDRSTVSGNISSDYDGNSTGGGIHNRGAMTINSSTISDNISNSGAGICNYGRMSVINSTISGNIIRWSGGGGGGIFNWDPFHTGVTLTIVNSTIAHNTGGGITSYCNDVACPRNESLVNTIVASNTLDGYPADIFGTIETVSHNVIGDAATSGGIVNGVNGNIVGVNALLAPLQNNGGPTHTHLLLTGSASINSGVNCVLTANGCGNGNPALLTDQRGMPRNGPVDIGAYERQSDEMSSSAAFDFDGDGRSDISVFRPSDSVWYLDRSAQGFSATQFGISTDKIVPADYDSDGKTDIAIFRGGTWYWMNSGTSTVNAVNFGVAGDVPVPADYTGDGRDEIAVYRSGQWWMLDLSTAQTSVTNFGLPTDKPVPADYDGDGRVDQAVYRNGQWHLNRSTQGYAVAQFGLPGDKPVVGDYDGDSKADLAIYRDGTWWILGSQAGGVSTAQWGMSTDLPAPADYDGDGKTDLSVYRDGQWWLLESTAGLALQQFGLAGDSPAPAAFLPQ